MNPSQGKKYVIAIDAVSASAAGTVGGTAVPYWDTQGWDEYSLALIGTTSDAASNMPSVLKIQHGETGAATHATSTAWSNIVKHTGGTATSATVGFVIPSDKTATSTKPFAVFNVVCSPDLGRYHRMVISPATTQTYTLLVAGKPNQSADNATAANVAVVSAG